MVNVLDSLVEMLGSNPATGTLVFLFPGGSYSSLSVMDNMVQVRDDNAILRKNSDGFVKAEETTKH